MDSTRTRSKLFQVAEEVQEAIHTGKPVVALETTIYTHGFPYPDNLALASHLESLVRTNGGVPATVGILHGKAHVGMSADELIDLVSTAGQSTTRKVSRRDLAFLGGLAGIRGEKLHGGTTISGTMVLAHLAGIKVFATGGLGGVHRGGETSLDISADLTELGRTPVAVIASGCKSFLDIPRTLEYLETQGVAVATFADGRDGSKHSIDFPAFFARDSGVPSPMVLRDEAEAAAVVHAQFELGVNSGLLFANPVPEEAAMKREEIDGIIEAAVREAAEMGVTGSKNTPYVLKRIRELSEGKTVTANRSLIEANVVRGTKVAVELARLESEGKRERGLKGLEQMAVPEMPLSHARPDPEHLNGLNIPNTPPNAPRRNDILVIGALAADTSCDYAPFTEQVDFSPVLYTSNPAIITGSAGGVGRNVATAAQYAGANVSLASVLADDLAGSTLLQALNLTGIDTSHMRVLECADGKRTAQYVAINDKRKDLVLAMADFSIFAHPDFERAKYWSDLVEALDVKPKWIVTDGNWSSNALGHILNAAKAAEIPVAFEPVSTAKAGRLFDKLNNTASMDAVVPNHVVSLTTPNKLELTAMHQAAQSARLFESEAWWTTIDSFGLSSAGSRDKFVRMLGVDLTNEGIPQQLIQLLPFIPNIICKLGAKGSLLAMVLRKGDPRLTRPEGAPYILSRSGYESGSVGGIYMRLFAPAEVVGEDEIVSVNGVGDTLLGVMLAGTVAEMKAGQKPQLEKILPLAQKAAVLTLKSNQAVSPAVKDLLIGSNI